MQQGKNMKEDQKKEGNGKENEEKEAFEENASYNR
jgi:hypothetical protein